MIKSTLLSTALVMVLALVSCSRGDDPSLSLVSVPQQTVAPSPVESSDGPIEITQEPVEPVEPVESVEPTSVPMLVVEPLTRGVDQKTVQIGIIKTGDVFKDVEVGVEARIRRLELDQVTDVRRIEIIETIDDGGKKQNALAAAKTMVEKGAFAVILASVGADTEVTDYLAEQNVPFFGWGFLDGFCYPNQWGFSFNGCLKGHALGISGTSLDTGSIRLAEIFYGREPEVILVTTSDDAGIATEFLTQQVWGNKLLSVVKIPTGQEIDVADYVLAEIADLDPDMLWLSIGLEQTLQVKARLVSSFQGMVVDDVTYLPGILREYEVSKNLEGGYVFTQFPPQEEYREATTRLATDLQNIGGPLIYSQAVSLGYWSVDLFMQIVAEVGEKLDTRTFFNVAKVQGILYDPKVSGGPCPMSTSFVHQNPSGGMALLQVRGGVYHPVVNFNCPNLD
ncbi:MAG: ABC transporter substrate-binding protein [Acidimicrobiales bacterium]|nr:ABC transporter substrate-binding protein [Acidimicrobiales bacterium]